MDLTGVRLFFAMSERAAPSVRWNYDRWLEARSERSRAIFMIRSVSVPRVIAAKAKGEMGKVTIVTTGSEGTKLTAHC